ncbi:Gfo/Idh/MocA family protein [Neolewinella persica]|uniref:Gfo/Idh/MocA family protein n=1 Tax=Neolewinella persica TaxID=70998 RepID=UPI00035FCEE9|nr:Gfo/Idh/MocA family oxidoreductase [Neolewinella persica]
MKNFVLIGAAGYIAPRHMKAIKDTGNNLLAAYDPCDSVGVIDSYFPEADFFTEFERFDRHLEKLKRKQVKIDYVSICSPNYLHDAHIRFGLRLGADVICEKPIVLNPWNLEALVDLEKEYPGNIYNILQLRLHESVVALKKRIDDGPADTLYDVDLQYVTARGKWYDYSWKGDVSKSGGIATNIGVHFFDMLMWIFGEVKAVEVFEHGKSIARGRLKLARANVNWVLSVDYDNLPESVKATGERTYRSLKIGREAFEFSGGFTELHTRSYQDILNGGGFRAEAAMPAIELVHAVRNSGG